MIENMRKYTGLMVVVFILLGAGFLFTMNDIGTSRGGGMGDGPTVLEVYDLALSQQEYRRMGDRTLQLASEAGITGYVNFLLSPSINELNLINNRFYGARFGHNFYNLLQASTKGEKDFIPHWNRFITNRIILQKAMDDMGVYANEEEVTEALKTTRRFAPNGKYDAAAYATFVEKRLGKLGMTEKDLREIVRENLCLNKIINIVGGGLTPPRSAVQDQVEAQSQTVTLARIVFNRDDLVEKENPTEEEIKTYWEAHQDTYKTDEQRRINYFLLTLPEKEKETESDKTQKLVKPAPLAADATEEQKTAHAAAEKAWSDQQAAEAKTKADKKAARTKAAKNLKRQILEISQEIYDAIDDKKPLDFAGILAKRNLTLSKTALFTRDTMPEEIKNLTLRGQVNRGRKLVDNIFSHSQSKDPYDLISDPLPVGEGGWIIFTLEEIVEPSLLDYTAARNKARAQLIGENADKKVKEAAKNARDEIVELMKSGKSFDAAAKEKGLVPVQVGPYTLGGIPPKDEPSHRQLHLAASGLNPGEVSEPINENDRSLFIYVDKREIEDTEENKRRIDYSLEGSKNELKILTFMNWLNHQYEKAEVKGQASQ